MPEVTGSILGRIFKKMHTKKCVFIGVRTQATRVAVQSPTTDLLAHACLKVSWLFIKSQASQTL
jgi:hypothetical protein